MGNCQTPPNSCLIAATNWNSYEALYAKILEARSMGLTKEQAVATIDLPEYSQMGMYDQWFKLNVGGMWFHMYGE